MEVPDPALRIAVPVPLSMVTEIEAMAVAHALSVPQFLRSIVVQHVQQARVRRAVQHLPPRRRKGRAE